MTTFDLFTQYQQALEQDARAAHRLLNATKARDDAAHDRDASQLALTKARDAFERASKKETTQNGRNEP